MVWDGLDLCIYCRGYPCLNMDDIKNLSLNSWCPLLYKHLFTGFLRARRFPVPALAGVPAQAWQLCKGTVTKAVRPA